MKKIIITFISLIIGILSRAQTVNEHYYFKNLSSQNGLSQNTVSAILYGAQNETYIEGWEKKTSNLLIYKRLCKV